MLSKSSSQKKDKNIALKAQQFYNSDNEDKDLDLNEDMTDLAKNLKKFFRLNKIFKNHSNKPNGKKIRDGHQIK